MPLEILAPCGGRESLIAAVRCGANAVYLGTKDLNARKNAENFDFDSLNNAVEYCHQRAVRVYLTLNTLVSDSEMETAYNTADRAMDAGVDAFIVQDPGVAKMMRDCFPSARLHASTQCSVTSPDGFNALKDKGFARAVLPREMMLDEIKEIRRSTDIELEMFVHGALCMCVSGQCYLSSMLGGRSGNRGLCAQPCRLAFSADNSGSHDLSLKDLSLIAHIGEIADAGVLSLKIEGRMKRPEYVAAAVTACKKAIEGKYERSDEETLKNIFSRSGFTDGYFTGKRENMFGIRQKEDVVAAPKVLKSLSHLYDKEAQTVPVDIDFVCKKGKPAALSMSSGGKTALVRSQIPEPAINAPLTEDGLKARLSRLGGTPYFARNITLSLDNGLNLPAKAVNEMRREAVEKLAKAEPRRYAKNEFQKIQKRRKITSPYYTARFSNAGQVPENHPFRRIFLPVWSKNEDFLKTNAGVEIPQGLFGMEEKLKSRLFELKKTGVKNALAGNAGAYKTAKDAGFNVFSDFRMNIYNSYFARQVNSPLLSFELTLGQANSINATDTGIVVYGHLPLMLTRNCPVKNNIGCEKCKKRGVLTDRKGYRFPVKCSPYPCVEILNSVPLNMSGRLDEINTDFIHFYFTGENEKEVEKIINMFKKNKNPTGAFTRGLYYRGVK